MPFVARPRQAATDLVGELLAKFARPLPHGFVADNNAARGEQLLHHAKTERKAEIQPHGMSDDLGREAISGIAGAGGCCHPTRLLIPIRRRKYPRATKLTVPMPLPPSTELPGAKASTSGQKSAALGSVRPWDILQPPKSG